MLTCNKVKASGYKTLRDLKKVPKSSTSELCPQTLPEWGLLVRGNNSFYVGTADPPDLLVSSKSVKSGSLVCVVYNKFSGPTPKSRSAWQRKISSAITTQGPDYLYKIMNLFLYMPIISPRREFINADFFFSPGALRQKHASRPWKCLRYVESLHPACVDTKWLVYYRSRWPEYMAICFHVVAVAWGGWGRPDTPDDDTAAESERQRQAVVRSTPHGTGASWTWGIRVGGMMNELTHPSILFQHFAVPPCCRSVLGPCAYCHSNPRPGWKQPPPRWEFSLRGRGVPISCFL